MRIGKKFIKATPLPPGEVKVGELIIPPTCVRYKWAKVTHVGDNIEHILVGDDVLYDPVFCERGTLLDGSVIMVPTTPMAIRRNGEILAGDGHILIEVPDRWLETDISTGGIYMTRNFKEWNKTSNIKRTAKVVAVGHGVTDIKVGDMAFFHFETLMHDRERILAEGIDCWSVSCMEPNWCHAVQRDGELLAVNDWLLVEPEKIPAKEIVNGIITLEDDSLSETVGTIRYGENRECSPHLVVGDKIMFHSDDAWLNDFGGEKLYVMRAGRPLGKIEP